MEYVTLNNGIKMPKLGYGVYQTPPEDTCRCVLDAIEVGYRAIDTAQAYYNEEGVGQALAESGLPREEFFLTTKVWITNAGYEKAKASMRSRCASFGRSTWTCSLSTSPSGTTTAPTGPWRSSTARGSSGPSASPTSGRTGIWISSTSRR